MRTQWPVNQKLQVLGEILSITVPLGERIQAENTADQAPSLIPVEKLLSILNKADYHDDCGSGHAHKEHDLKDVHCEQTECHTAIVPRIDMTFYAVFYRGKGIAGKPRFAVTPNADHFGPAKVFVCED